MMLFYGNQQTSVTATCNVRRDRKHVCLCEYARVCAHPRCFNFGNSGDAPRSRGACYLSNVVLSDYVWCHGKYAASANVYNGENTAVTVRETSRFFTVFTSAYMATCVVSVSLTGGVIRDGLVKEKNIRSC